jgi:protein XagA
MHSSYKKSAVIVAVISIPFIFLLTGICIAGAWTMQKGNIYDRLSANFYLAKDEFDSDGERRDFPLNGEFRDLYVNNYIEYGITDSITLINSIYYKTIKKHDDVVEQKTWGIGDIDVAAKFKVADGSWGILSSQALIKVPGPYDRNDELPLGNGQLDLEIRLLYGRSLYPHIPGYCNFELGYRWRFEDPSDEVRYLIEFGIDFTKKFYGRVKLDGIYSMDNGQHYDPTGNPTATNNFDLGKLDTAIGYKLSKDWAIELGYMPEIYGQNTAAGATYTIALTYQTH